MKVFNCLKLRRIASVVLVGAASALGAGSAAAEYPERLIRLIVPYGPGGATDVAARILADGMGKVLKQPVIVENKPGANGLIAIQAVAAAPADGYTILVGNVTTNAIGPLLKAGGSALDARPDLRIVTRLGEIPAILVATKKNFPPTNVAELVTHARANPNTIFYNAAGVLSYSHLDMLEFQKKAGIKLDLVPMSAGGGGSQTDIVTGEVQLALRNAASAASFVKNGQIKALAVTSDARLPAFPDVPTMKEQGFDGIGTNAWQAMFAPSRTPEPLVARLNAAAISALQDPVIQKRFAEQMITVTLTATPAEAQKWLDAEFVRWAPIVAEGKRAEEKR